MAPTRCYLDAAVVAPVLDAAAQAHAAALAEGWADPRRVHREGRRARLLLESAREEIATLVGARTPEVGFATSLPTAATGVLRGYTRPETGRRHLLASAVEHSAVLALTARGDAGSGTVAVDRLGRIDLDRLAATLARGPAPAALALQAANPEVGTLQPLASAAAECLRHGVPLVVDATASLGALGPPDHWDALVADARSWGSPAGVAVVAVREDGRWRAPSTSAEGTEPLGEEVPVAAALAAAVALQEATRARAEDARRLRGLLERIRRAAAGIPDTEVAGPAQPEHRLPHVLTFSCLYLDGEALADELDREGFSVGSGSACASAGGRPSHVLDAMGVLTHGNVRIGLAPGTSVEDVERFCATLPTTVARLRERTGVSAL